VVEPDSVDKALFPERVGDRLRSARIKAKLDLNDVAGRTRVPLRHLEGIEQGNYSGMPSPTYSIGFAKSYARAVGEDPETIARMLRDEIGQRQPEQRGESIDFEDADPSRLPTRTMALTALAIIVLILAGYSYWRGWLLRDPALPPAQPEIVEATQAPVARPPAPATLSPTGEVVLTAREPVWLRIYDANDKVLLQKEMAAGERFVVPADANKPMIRTGRAELIAVTIDGRDVAPLGPPERTIKDVEIGAAALTARAAPAAGPGVANAASSANPSATAPIAGNAATLP
jgi:cytoskeleton protein RodZ